MRLTCPNCAAEYEIADDLVPAEGRDVECSNCGQVWFQPSEQAGAAAPFDPSARPALNRQLNESMLSVLREEAARELGARAAERQSKPAATDAVEKAVPAENIADQGDAASPYDIQLTDWPATTITDDTNTVAGPPSAPPPPSEAAPMVLPDAQVMAATLTAAAPAQPSANVPVPAATQMPVLVAAEPAPSRKSYWNGFNLAVLIAALIVAAYIAAPHVAGDGPVGQQILAWREAADQGRAWLYDHASALYRKTGE